MTIQTLVKELKADEVGEEIHALIRELYPLCRSITGDGVRETLRRLNKRIPLRIHEVPTGTPVFDWTVPKEWNIRDAFIADRSGRRLVDFQASTLHIVSYSRPITARLRFADLRPHLFTIPDRPDWIPYRTSYYRDDWGFCLTERQLAQLREDEEYDVCIDATLADGQLTYGEWTVEGEASEDVLLSCHICHPSLCNDNLSSIALATVLAGYLAQVPRRYGYRLLFAPSTIGSITWLSRNEQHLDRLRHGLVLACLGDRGQFTYKRSRRGRALIDRIVPAVLDQMAMAHTVMDFVPYGYDERQFCSPGFNLPIGCLMRTPHGQFPEYHTSADNLDFVTPAALGESFTVLLSILQNLELNHTYVNTKPKCEPQLGSRGLYRHIGGAHDARSVEMALLWVLNFSDGRHSLLDILERSGLSMEVLHAAATSLAAHHLLIPVPPQRSGHT